MLGVSKIIKLRLSFIMAPVLLLGLFLSQPLFSQTSSDDRVLKIAVFDTPFCPKLINKTKKNIKILPPYLPYGGQRAPSVECYEDLNGRHGLHVLNHLLKVIPKLDYPIEIHPIIIYTRKGMQSEKSWSDAIKRAKEQKIDILLLAVGLPSQKPLQVLTELPFNTFMASGQMSGRIRQSTLVWPQSLDKNDRSVMVGAYLPPTEQLPDQYLQDKTLLHVKKIDYYFSGGDYKARLTGSSRAVTTALGKSLLLCPRINFIDRHLKELKKCLKSKKRALKDSYSNFIFATF
jgi:hypothetical protein